jgi:cbb3-type cytochrome oxidase maturation protein
MIEHLTLGEFVVATLMGLAAVSVFLWAIASGALGDVEKTKHQVLECEEQADERRTL